MESDEFIRRLQREVVDSYDEELELELEDRPFDATGTEVPLSEQEKRERRRYFRELLRLQGELVKLQDWVVASGHKLVIPFEGRDAAGKGGVIKRITQRLNPRSCRVAAGRRSRCRSGCGTRTIRAGRCPPTCSSPRSIEPA